MHPHAHFCFYKTSCDFYVSWLWHYFSWMWSHSGDCFLQIWLYILQLLWFLIIGNLQLSHTCNFMSYYWDLISYTFVTFLQLRLVHNWDFISQLWLFLIIGTLCLAVAATYLSCDDFFWLQLCHNCNLMDYIRDFISHNCDFMTVATIFLNCDLGKISITKKIATVTQLLQFFIIGGLYLAFATLFL